MQYSPPGHHRSVEDFRAHLLEVDPELACDDEVLGRDGPLGQPLEVLGRTVSNRFCIHPMEGWDGERDGTPSELTLRRWERFGSSGAKLIWGGEAFAVVPEGRANPRQLCHHPEGDTRAGLERLLEALRRGHAALDEDPDDLVVGLQLTHSGRYSNPEGTPSPRIAVHNPILDARQGTTTSPVISEDELQRIRDAYVRSAELAQAAGFAFVDVKCCHGYLMHEMLGARARGGRYGGSFENRARLFREVVEGIRASCPGLGIAARVSAGDVFPHEPGPDGVGRPKGWREHVPFEHGFGVDREDPRRMDTREPLRFLELLRELGLRTLNVSLGTPYTSPHLQRPASSPPSDGYLPPEDPLKSVGRHLRATRLVKRLFPGSVVVGSGYTYLQEWLPHVAQHELRAGHVDLVGLGRMVLSYPGLPADVLAGRELDRRKLCRTFSDCTTGPRQGLVSGCYPLDAHYKTHPDAVRLKRVKQGEASRGGA